ncbi:MAG: DUF2179 domain-containing protein [Anaerolineae bacterium]|jgi:uncharacterized protein YebE (UPF0316 family)|nr:DUF2179 domain-containing protein [Anaerolineae bacterium]
MENVLDLINGLGAAPLLMRIALPLLIFLARFVDVSLGTLRIIALSRGNRYLAPLLGFVEVFIWIMVVSQIIKSANDIWSYLAYSAGFAAGNFAGMFLENKLAMGTVIIRTILPIKPKDLICTLHESGYGTTCVQGEGYQSEVFLLYTIIKRRDLKHVVGVIHQHFPKAFITIEELRSVEAGIFPTRQTSNLQRSILGRKK